MQSPWGSYVLENATASMEDIYCLKQGSLLPLKEFSDEVTLILKERVQKLRGSVGREFFQKGKFHKGKLLFDFLQGALFIVNDEKFLKNYCLEKFAQAPLEERPEGFVVTLETDFGPRKFSLNSGADMSFIRRSLAEHKAIEELPSGLQLVTSDHFSAGSIDLGYQKLGLYDLREGDIDGILGIDFFMRTIYLDVEAGKAYFGPRGMVIQ